MRQRIKLAQAMVHDPDIILLDEPLNGLDPVGRHEFLSVLGHLSEMGKTIIVSSHILYEVEQMTRSILLLHRGRLLATGDLRVIRDLIDKYPHKVRIETPRPREVAGKLTQLTGVVSAKVDDRNEVINLEVNNPTNSTKSSAAWCWRMACRSLALRAPTTTWNRCSSTWWRAKCWSPIATCSAKGFAFEKCFLG